MDAKNDPVTNHTIVERTSERELVVTRTFNGPVQIVFDAWTKPELLTRWWAPKSLGVTLFECQSDLRVGGAYRFAFGRDPQNPEVFSGRYDVVDVPARLVLTQVYERFRDAGEVVVTVAFEDGDGKTRVTLHQLYPSKDALDGAIASGMERGMRETLDQLELLMTSLSATSQPTLERKSERELVLTRSFNGSARAVFQAWSKPELFKRWWTPKSYGLTILSCEMDVRTGGTYRLEMGHPASDKPMAFFGRYLDVVPNARIVWTNDESGEGGAVTTVTLTEKDGKTLLVMHELYPSKEALDEAIASQSTSGYDETFAQLDALLLTEEV